MVWSPQLCRRLVRQALRPHDLQALSLPRLETAVHFHDGIALRGELHRGVGAQMAVLGIAVDDVHSIPAQTGHGAPLFLGEADRPGEMALLEVFSLPHVDDGHIFSLLNLVADFDGSRRKSHLVREELLRFGCVALDCLSHNDFLFRYFFMAVMRCRCSPTTGMDLSTKLLISASFVLADSALNSLASILWSFIMSAI